MTELRYPNESPDYRIARQADYKCQGENDDMPWLILHVFKKHGGEIFHFWGTELQGSHVEPAIARYSRPKEGKYVLQRQAPSLPTTM